MYSFFKPPEDEDRFSDDVNPEKPYHDEYTPAEEECEERIYRTLAEEEQRQLDADRERIGRMLKSLGPEDSARRLFTFDERKAFNIPWFRRPRPK